MDAIIEAFGRRKMALHNLVEGDCGSPSPLMRLTSHLIQDRGLKDEGLYDFYGNTDPFQSGNSDQLVKQFLEETSAQPQTFKMGSLLQEMRDIDQNAYRPVTAPGVAQELANQDTVWANQYLEAGRHFDVHIFLLSSTTTFAILFLIRLVFDASSVERKLELGLLVFA